MTWFNPQLFLGKASKAVRSTSHVNEFWACCVHVFLHVWVSRNQLRQALLRKYYTICLAPAQYSLREQLSQENCSQERYSALRPSCDQVHSDFRMGQTSMSEAQLDRTWRRLALKTATYLDGQPDLHQRGGLKRASEAPFFD